MRAFIILVSIPHENDDGESGWAYDVFADSEEEAIKALKNSRELNRNGMITPKTEFEIIKEFTKPAVGRAYNFIPDEDMYDDDQMKKRKKIRKKKLMNKRRGG